jgi:hypothetical protein
VGHAEGGSAISEREGLHGRQPLERDVGLGAPECLALRPGAMQAGDNPFADALLLELGQRRQHMELQPPGRGRQVEALAQRDQTHSEVMPVFNRDLLHCKSGRWSITPTTN